MTRSVYCTCGWRGRRAAHRNELPCPRCGGVVYLSSAGRGRPTADTVRVSTRLPRRWAELLGPGPIAASVRNAVRFRLQAEGHDVPEAF